MSYQDKPMNNPTYNKRQGKVFQCNAISQKLDDPES